MSSMPAEMRTRPSVMPMAARRSGGTDAWVIVAGWEMRLSTPPRLSASASSRTLLSSRRAASSDPRSNESMPPKPFICRARQRVLRMRRQARDRRPAAPSGAPPGNSASARPFSLCCVMRTASVLVPRRTSHESNGLEDRAGRVLVEPQPLEVRVGRRDDDAADAVAVAVQVFRGAVQHHVGAELDRPLHGGAGERVVDHQLRAVSVRQRGRGGQVRQAQHRVGRRLDEQQLRGRRERVRGGIEIAGVHVGEVQLVPPQHALEEPERAAIRVVGDDDVVARLRGTRRRRRWRPCPRRTRSAPVPPSIAARLASSAARVGFCVRAYS